MRRRVGTVLLTLWAASAAVPGAVASDLVSGLPGEEFSEKDLAATSAPPPDPTVQGAEQRLLALGADQGMSRRQPQRIDTPAWILPPFEGVVRGLAGAGFPADDLILMSLPDPVAP